MKFWSSNADGINKSSGALAHNSDKSHTKDAAYYLDNLWYDLTYYSHCFFSWLDNSLLSLAANMNESLESHSLDSLVIAIKFLLLVALLIFVRGGIPRYRFDHLTKMGWIKYLSLVLASLLVQVLLLYCM